VRETRQQGRPRSSARFSIYISGLKATFATRAPGGWEAPIFARGLYDAGGTTSQRHTPLHLPQVLVWTEGLPEWLPMVDAQPLLEQQEDEEATAAAAAGDEPPAEEEGRLTCTSADRPALDPHAYSAEPPPPPTAGAAWEALALTATPMTRGQPSDPFGPPAAWEAGAAWGEASSGSSPSWHADPFGVALDAPELAVAQVRP
jgi:hypothetical protein